MNQGYCLCCNNQAITGEHYCEACMNEFGVFTDSDEQESRYVCDMCGCDSPTQTCDKCSNPLGDWNPEQSDEWDSIEPNENVCAGRDLDIECYHNIFKSIYGVRPHHMDFDAMTDDEIHLALLDLNQHDDIPPF